VERYRKVSVKLWEAHWLLIVPLILNPLTYRLAIGGRASSK